MDQIPADLVLLFVPDADTLGALLRVCKWINSALMSGGKFVLKGMTLGNSILTCTLCAHRANIISTVHYNGFTKRYVSGNTPTGIESEFVLVIRSLLYDLDESGWKYVKIAEKYKWCNMGYGTGKKPKAASQTKYIIMVRRGFGSGNGEWYYCRDVRVASEDVDLCRPFHLYKLVE